MPHRTIACNYIACICHAFGSMLRRSLASGGGVGAAAAQVAADASAIVSLPFIHVFVER
jgi:hypothetical protein